VSPISKSHERVGDDGVLAGTAEQVADGDHSLNLPGAWHGLVADVVGLGLAGQGRPSFDFQLPASSPTLVLGRVEGQFPVWLKVTGRRQDANAAGRSRVWPAVLPVNYKWQTTRCCTSARHSALDGELQTGIADGDYLVVVESGYIDVPWQRAGAC
jgi:hypothetical protein